MTTAQVGETSVTVNSNNPIQDHVHPDDQTQPSLSHCDGHLIYNGDFLTFTLPIIFFFQLEIKERERIIY